MGFAQLHDSFWLNPKVRGLSDSAFRAYVTAISFSSANNTDGFIASYALPALGSTEEAAVELVASGLWEEEENGWAIHDYADHNRTSEDRAKLQARAAAGGRAKAAKAAATSREQAPAISSEDVLLQAEDESCQYNAMQSIALQSNAEQSTALHEEPKGSSTALKAKRASPRTKKPVIPLTDEQRERLIADYPDIDVPFQIDLALDHESARKYTDMNRYLRNWMNNQRLWGKTTSTSKPREASNGTTERPVSEFERKLLAAGKLVGL